MCLIGTKRFMLRVIMGKKVQNVLKHFFEVVRKAASCCSSSAFSTNSMYVCNVFGLLPLKKDTTNARNSTGKLKHRGRMPSYRCWIHHQALTSAVMSCLP